MIGEGLLANGASAEETEAGMLVAAAAYDQRHCEPHVTLAVVSMTYRSENGDAPVTVSRPLRSQATDFTALQRTHQLVQHIHDGRLTLAQARNRAAAIVAAARPAAKPSASRRVRTAVLQSGLVAAGGTVLVDGDAVITACSLAAATLGALVAAWLGKYGVPTFYRFACAAVPAALVAALLDLESHVQAQAVVVGGLLAMLPSLSIISAVQDSLTGHYLAAYVRFLDACIVFLGIVAGTILTLTLVAQLRAGAPLDPPSNDPELSLSWRVVGAPVFAVAMAARMNVPRRAWPAIALISVAGLATFVEIREMGFPRLFSTGLAAVVVGVLGQLAARPKRVSALPLVAPGVAPLLPGMVMYRGLRETADNRLALGLDSLAEALGTCLALAVGVCAAGEIYLLIRQLRAGRPAPDTAGPEQPR
ncbi:threonine/serine exporter family protein [Streptomyces sp. NPDC050147]|uniref:threonine/serine ThrE exporter family protein n=1 Tax=Streptomyces sp. NPDC050147 TaxID=3155513 RepID=UPI003435521E